MGSSNSSEDITLVEIQAMPQVEPQAITPLCLPQVEPQVTTPPCLPPGVLLGTGLRDRSYWINMFKNDRKSTNCTTL